MVKQYDIIPSMIIDFPPATDQKVHQYCIRCHAEAIERVYESGKTFYKCNQCKSVLPRSLVIDPGVVWWVDPQSKEYWHESVGIFIGNDQNQILLFERKIYPFAYTIPSGHLDTGEDPQTAVIREVEEEVGIKLNDVALFSQEDVPGDECRRGADNHRWSLFVAKLPENFRITVNDEGVRAVWLTIDQALSEKLTYPVRHFLEKYGNRLLQG